MAKLPTVALKAVVPIILRRAKERAMLEEDLCRMDCHGLMKRPWCLKYQKIVAKLLTNRDNWWIGTVYQDPETWIAST